MSSATTSTPPAEYLTLVPSIPDEYKKLGSYALVGLPSSYQPRFVDSGEFKSKYSILNVRDNFSCGSSCEHAPMALRARGLAESYARIFFRNSVATREVYPIESEVRICEECKTGDVLTIGQSLLINHTTGKEYKLKPIGDAGLVIEAGGIWFAKTKCDAQWNLIRHQVLGVQIKVVALHGSGLE